MGEREELIDIIDPDAGRLCMAPHASVIHAADRILAAGYHNGPRILSDAGTIAQLTRERDEALRLARRLLETSIAVQKQRDDLTVVVAAAEARVAAGWSANIGAADEFTRNARAVVETHVAELTEALKELIEAADDAGWSANVGTMDDAIRRARAALAHGREGEGRS